MGEWAPPEGSEIEGPPAANPIVGHVVNRLFNMVHPPSVSNCNSSHSIWGIHIYGDIVDQKLTSSTLHKSLHDQPLPRKIILWVVFK